MIRYNLPSHIHHLQYPSPVSRSVYAIPNSLRPLLRRLPHPVPTSSFGFQRLCPFCTSHTFLRAGQDGEWNNSFTGYHWDRTFLTSIVNFVTDFLISISDFLGMETISKAMNWEIWTPCCVANQPPVGTTTMSAIVLQLPGSQHFEP